jgi:hypothetical protein
MITCKLQGGIGNQLFQIFTTIAYALKHSQSFFFMDIEQLGNGENGSTIRYTYWNTFLHSLKPFLKLPTEIPPLIKYKEDNFHYSLLLTDKRSENTGYATMLVGYFQSYKYFDYYKDILFKLIKIPQHKLNIKEKYKYIDFENTISIHFRVGDYKFYPDLYPILTSEYYINAINKIKESNNIENYNILYFYNPLEKDDVQSTINIINKEFPFLPVQTLKSETSDWEQLLIMSLCKYNIIANSTFSWWGAYFNQSLNNIVYYPDQWFKEDLSRQNVIRDTKDLFPNNWIKVCSKV